MSRGVQSDVSPWDVVARHTALPDEFESVLRDGYGVTGLSVSVTKGERPDITVHFEFDVNDDERAFREDATGFTRAVELNYPRAYRDWGARFWSARNTMGGARPAAVVVGQFTGELRLVEHDAGGVRPVITGYEAFAQWLVAEVRGDHYSCGHDGTQPVTTASSAEQQLDDTNDTTVVDISLQSAGQMRTDSTADDAAEGDEVDGGGASIPDCPECGGGDNRQLSTGEWVCQTCTHCWLED